MSKMEVRKYYEEEAQSLLDHQKKMYFGDQWTNYWHGTRFMKLLKIIKMLQFKSFLEVGCAEGYYLKFIINKNNSQYIHRVGLDLAKGHLNKARANVCGSELVLGDAVKLPFKNRCFEIVFCSEVLEHVLDPQKVFTELTRTSKKYVLLTVAGENLFYHLAKKIKLIKAESNHYIKTGQGHINEMRIKEITDKWANEGKLKVLHYNIDCHLPIAFFQKYRVPTFLIPVIRIVDIIINRLPVIREYGSSQIVLFKIHKDNY